MTLDGLSQATGTRLQIKLHDCHWPTPAARLPPGPRWNTLIKTRMIAINPIATERIVCMAHPTHEVNMKGSLLVVSLTLLIFLATGCSSSGQFSSVNLTNVELSENNYRIVATSVSGEATAGYLLGISFGNGSNQATLALVRVKGEGLLYKEALENLWDNFEQEYGSPEGRKLALVNVRYDTDNLNLLVYTKPKISIRADIVEFIE